MAEYTTRYSPMHIDCTIGQPYGNPSSSYSCGFHTGVDFPQSGVAVQNPDLYSITDDGEVVYVYNQSTGTTPSLRKSSPNFRPSNRSLLQILPHAIRKCNIKCRGQSKP